MPHPRLFITLLLLTLSGSVASQESPKRIAGTERVQVNLVLIDIIVRDRKDQPVRGLTRDDFELRVDGALVDPSDIESFEEICGEPADGVPSAGTATSPLRTPAAAPSVASPAVPRYIVIYFDFSHLSLGGARLAMRGARDQIVRHLDPADRMMILAYKNGLRLVQDFTSDATLLARRIDDMRADPATIETDVVEEDANALEVKETPCGDESCSFRRAAASARAIREAMRGRRSLEALTNLMHALAGIKGRKAVVLFTETLRQEPGAEYYVFTPVTPREEGISLEREMLRLTTEANAAGVSFYAVYGGGMTADEGGMDPLGQSRSAGNDSARALQTNLASDTGGRALRNTNDLGAILASASRDLSCYYLLGYRYQGRGDDKRHKLVVKLKRGREISQGGSLTVRHRPYFVDQGREDRRDRLVRSALVAPALFHGLPVVAEAYALAPTRPGPSARAGRRVLIKTMVPFASLPLLPGADGWLEGRIALRGRVTARDGRQVCEFDHEMPLRIPREEVEMGGLIYETGCVLTPDSYTLTLTALDPTTLEIGTYRTPLTVSTPGFARGGYLSEFYLWLREPGTLLVTSGLGSIGITDAVSTRGLIPQPERRMDGRRDAALSFTLCVPDGKPIQIRRALMGAGNEKVSDFEDLNISEPPDPETGCYQVSTAIRANTLGAGIYKFLVEVSGAGLNEPMRREVNLAVE